MLDKVAVELLTTEQCEYESLGLSLTERRLICLYRQMTEQERRQIRRLISQIASTEES